MYLYFVATSYTLNVRNKLNMYSIFYIVFIAAGYASVVYIQL